MDTSFVSILSNVVSGYPYFSLLYILIFWRKIKSDEFYSSLILASNILFSSLTLVVFLYYFIEIFTAWYSGNMYESYAFASRAYGVLNYQFYFGLFLFTLILPLIFWLSCRTRRPRCGLLHTPPDPAKPPSAPLRAALQAAFPAHQKAHACGPPIMASFAINTIAACARFIRARGINDA